MTAIFIDTSAFVALLDAGDQQHEAAVTVWQNLIEEGNVLICNNYVLLETYALVQRRFGLLVLRTFQEEAYPLLEVEWLGPDRHESALSAVLAANRRDLSLVDCASMETMRRLGIRTIFAFDPHFTELRFENSTSN